MKLRHVESALSQLEGFAAPRVALEQYATPPALAARIVADAAARGDVAERTVLDLGCGCGALSAAAALLGADLVLGVDCDDAALAAAARNVARLELECQIELVCADVAALLARLRAAPRAPGLHVDTVLLNPPFGTRRAGADLVFLECAVRAVARRGGAVYSLHKSSTRAHVLRCARQWGAQRRARDRQPALQPRPLVRVSPQKVG